MYDDIIKRGGLSHLDSSNLSWMERITLQCMDSIERLLFNAFLNDIADLNFANVRKTLSGENILEDKEEREALLKATDTNFLEVIRTLITTKIENIDVKSPVFSMKTALHYAVQNTDSDVVKFLLEHGANVQTKLNGENPFELAYKAGKMTNCKILIEYGAEVCGRKSWSGEDYERLLRYQVNFKNAVEQVSNNNDSLSENRYTELTSEEIQVLKEFKANRMKEVDSRIIPADKKLNEINIESKNEIAVIKNQVGEFEEECKQKIASVENEIFIARKKLDELEAIKELEESNLMKGIQELKEKEREIHSKTERVECERLVFVAEKFRLNQEFKMIEAEWKRKSKSHLFKDYLTEEIRILEKDLKCPSCEKVSEVPIYTCASQHSICGKCWSEKELQFCPVCNVPISNPPNKHRLMESLASKLEKFRNTYEDLH